MAFDRFRKALFPTYSSPQIEFVEGKGLLVRLRLSAPRIAIKDAAREPGLLVGVAGADVVRLAAPLIVSDEEKKALEILSEAIADTQLSTN